MENLFHLVNTVHHPLDIFLPTLSCFCSNTSGQHFESFLCFCNNKLIKFSIKMFKNIDCLDKLSIILNYLLESQFIFDAFTCILLSFFERLAPNPYNCHVKQLGFQFAFFVVKKLFMLIFSTNFIKTLSES